MIASAPVLPNVFYIRRDDAADVAVGIVQAIHVIGRPLYIYLKPDGAIGFELQMREHEPDGQSIYLVGYYTERATVGLIRDDIIASQRERLT